MLDNCEICKTAFESESELYVIDICKDCIDKIQMWGIKEREVTVLTEAIKFTLDQGHLLLGTTISERLQAALDLCKKV